jgi:NAD(P)-dependent dehydrogenase (short-subunit alcohol dehydrogenase family)
VTGASSGIGYAVTRRLLDTGHTVTLVARREDRLREAAARLGAGDRTLTFPADLSDPDVTAAIAAHHEAAFGRLDVLVNCAGVGRPQAIDDLGAKRLALHLDLNLVAPAALCREAGPMLRRAGVEHGNALVVNVASIVGVRGVRNFAAYSASKAALIRFTEVMNDEWGERGVKATVICPGLVATPFSEGVGADFPLIDPEDVSNAVGFLLTLSRGCLVPELTMTAPGGDALKGIRA